ncbi:BTAD domain-containing putative transcriptional regulator [Streptomyces sp. NPDC059524]|uniref:BTAD domain-containing putative transcriptional regulator n=1 Tax=Streptomyces sp. NPDC059524 TaxID=3346856 RepID=UPI003680C068
MHWGVLGPLGVWTDGGAEVRVPELKVRALLAHLLAHRGQPVSADRLVEDLWGAQPPNNPAAALQNKVWQLRKVLEAAEPGGRDLVARRPAGYELLAAQDSLDAGRFQELLGRARSAADPASRSGLLTDALALWRGPAFADFADEDFVRAAAARLDEQRLTAIEEQAEARLELGRHALVADDLSDLVSLHPLRERARAAHVRALYAAGRRQEALRGLAELRARLAEDLGIDPGPEITELQQAILAQDPALLANPTPTPTPAPPPAPAPTGHAPAAMPAQLTELIGRDEAVAGLRALLGAHRLVTLTGPGGVGKTRLALATAARLAPDFPGGVHLAELAGLDTAETIDEKAAEPTAGTADGTGHGTAGVADVLRAVFGLRDDTAPPGGAPQPLAGRIAHTLAGRPALLVLDNCEHVAAPAARVAEQLLRTAPSLRVLATSQVPLGLTGEALEEVPPLPHPGSAEGLSAADVRKFGAVELFVARAQAAAPRFVLDDTTLDAVVSVCRRLDGIPLALEMAATRVRALGVHELAARLDDRFSLLAVGSRGAPARQRTLRAVIDWSWGLLGAGERAVLRRLAVHADGCTLAAAEELCAGQGVDRTEVLDLLARLVDGSLLQMHEGPEGGPRYRLLESVGAYAAERLTESGEAADLRRAHRAYYRALAEDAEPHLRGPAQREWLRRLDAEQANLRSALDGAVAAGDADCALRLANSLARYWQLRGRYAEARRALTAALDTVSAPGVRTEPTLSARATALRGGFRLLLGGTSDPAAEYRAALRPYDAVDDPHGRATAEWFLASQQYGVGDPRPSQELLASALDAFRRLGDRWGTAAALAGQAFHAQLRGDSGTVRRNGGRSLELFRELGDQWGQLQAMVPLQMDAQVAGDYARAERLHREGLRMAEDLELWPAVCFQLSGLGRIALLGGDLPRAREFHDRARRLAVARSDRFGEQYAETGLGIGARREGRLDAAEAHLRHVLEVHRQMGYEPEAPALILAELGFVAELRGDAPAALRLQLDGLAAAHAAGSPRSLALGFEGLAGARALTGEPARAARLLGAADTLRRSVGAPLPEGERDDVDRVEAAARQALGDTRFDTAYEQGTALAPDALLKHPSIADHDGV